ncbi:tetratricopeptide repeat protein [Sulfuricurvum sp.]|uniref:tetratricopeptide repeat protein n=1 Tax=Sulfuricurvum sp. TaxID=2025608 RepID=UPI003BB0B374
MNHKCLRVPVLVATLLFATAAQATETQQSETIEKPLFTPLIERYILDELKSVRTDQQQLRNDTEKRISRAEVEQTDRAARYVTDTIGNIFYLIAAATSLLIFAGWNSLRDIRKKTEDMIEIRVEQITKKYNEELELLQKRLGEQSKKILDNQNRIYTTQFSHSLWMRANLETNLQSKIEIYDEILKLNPDDSEAYAYKADAVLDLDQYEWALNLSDKAIEIDQDYGYAYWQRACAHAKLGSKIEAISDLKTALHKNQNLREDIEHEPSFEHIKDSKEFKEAIL